MADLVGRGGFGRRDLHALAADALRGLAGNRHQALWRVTSLREPLPLVGETEEAALPLLPPPTAGQGLVTDYASMGLRLGGHPLALIRGHLRQRGLQQASAVNDTADGARVRTAGLVITRQR